MASPNPLKSPIPEGFEYSAPGGSSSSGSSEHYDYSGLDRHIKMQDELAQTRNAKYRQLYGGDVAGAVGSSQRIRDLLSQLRPNAPATTEANPYQIASPLVRTESASTHSGNDFEGARVAQKHPNGQDRSAAILKNT